MRKKIRFNKWRKGWYALFNPSLAWSENSQRCSKIWLIKIWFFNAPSPLKKSFFFSFFFVVEMEHNPVNGLHKRPGYEKKIGKWVRRREGEHQKRNIGDHRGGCWSVRVVQKCERRKAAPCRWYPDFQLVRTTVRTGSHNFPGRFTPVHIIFSFGSHWFTYFLRRHSQEYVFGSHRFA